MSRVIRHAGMMILALLLPVAAVQGLEVSQIEFDLYLAAGGDAVYSFLVSNNEARAQEITVYKGDWTRTLTGMNDFLPLNGARWLFLREFQPGETLDIVYRVELSGQEVTVHGTHVSASPSEQGQIDGDFHLSVPASDFSPAHSEGLIDVSREILSVSPDGKSVTIRLAVHVNEVFTGLRLDEVFSSHVSIEPIDLADGEFTAVEQSNGDWLDVSPTGFLLEEGESREVSFAIRVPEEASGGSWGAIFVEGAPRADKLEGTPVLAVTRFAIKVYATVPGTEVRAGTVPGVDVLATDPLSFEVLFENTGNVQVRPSGSIDIISSTGEIVQELAINGFPVLPGAVRLLTLTDMAADPLPLGIYRALVAIDYGGEALASGVWEFRIR
jgi:hypothetical protein